jgi:hypothetical protein
MTLDASEFMGYVTWAKCSYLLLIVVGEQQSCNDEHTHGLQQNGAASSKIIVTLHSHN